MKTNGKLQLYPCLRVAMCLIAGIYVGDATAACVPLVLWQWLFVGLLAVVLLLYLLNRHAIVQTLILFGIMMAGGAWRIAYVERQQRYAFSGEEETYEAVVVAQPIEKKRSFKCELAIVRGRLAGHRVNAYFQKSHTDTAALSLTVGDGITAQSVFSHFDDDARAQRGGFSWRRQRMVRDIVARTFIASDGWKRAEVSVRGMTWLGRLGLSLQSLRQRLLRRLRGSSVSEDAYATIAAMTLGDKTALTTQLRESYSKAGVSHVLALSGLHLGIIYAMLALLLGQRRNTMLGLVATITLIWLFALMVGMSPGIVRSAAMFTLYTSMSYLSREYLTLNSLAAAA
ncbi:ComEC/Rec2 family competence protein, partial [Leyella stercorea]|uniref:ComEC/Rec2 family competence protein n=1 Tax=Leyella stercorea TaxID=363265 RepID=UPI00258672E9